MANRYFRNTGNVNWSVTSNWSTTSGGSADAAVPTSADDVFFTAASGPCTVDISAVALSVNFTGYFRTINLDQTLTVTGAVTLAAGMLMTASILGYLVFNGAVGSLRSNGVELQRLRLGSGASLTLLDQANIGTSINQLSGSSSYLGSFGFTTPAWSISSSAGNIHTLQAGIQYVTGSLVYQTEVGSAHGVIKSSTGGTKAKLKVLGSQILGYVDFTDIDASGGRTIYGFNAVISNCTNVVNMTDKYQFSDLTVENSFIL